MAEEIKHDELKHFTTIEFESREMLYGAYAAYRCLGTPREFIELVDSPNVYRLHMLSEDGETPPPGMSRTKERLEAQVESFHGAVEGLKTAVQAATGWPCTHTMTYDPKTGDFMLTFDTAVLPGPPEEIGKKWEALQGLMKNIFRETRITIPVAHFHPAEDHPLRCFGRNALSLQMPMSPQFLKVAHCNTIAPYLPGGDGDSMSLY